MVVMVGGVLAGMGGCGSDNEGGSGGAAATGSGSGTGTGSGSGTGSGGGGSGTGRCLPGCTTAADCCAQGQAGCPDGPYPNNPTCEGGYCRAAQCSTTADCTALGPTLDCLTNSGIKSCGITCAQDADCPMGTTCSGSDANGKQFCKGTGTGKECMVDMDCTGRGKCVNNSCVCDSNADCTNTKYNTCIK